MTAEENFPRGGKIAAKRPPQEPDRLFNVAKPPKAKKAKKSKKAVEAEEIQDLSMTLDLKGTLDYSKIQSGMTILACIRRITNLALEVELPGLCFALVPITHISEVFNKYLGERLEQNDLEISLRDIFAVGEFLPVKIVDVTSTNDVTRIEASTNPAHVHAPRHFNSFAKGHVVWATPTARADHGYEMSVGVAAARAFMPFKNADAGPDLALGKPMWCVVHKFEATPTASLMRLSAKTEHVRACQTDSLDNVDVIVPGTRVEFPVVRVSAHGIYGKIGNFTVYVDENYLARPLNKMADYEERAILKGYVLYVAPSTKVVYVTLRHPDAQAPPALSNGDVVAAQVHGKATNGVFFRLPGALKGFATNKRLIAALAAEGATTLTADGGADLSSAIVGKYRPGSEHACRVLDYNRLSATYVVTTEAREVRASRDLRAGQSVKVRVRAVKDEGVVVECGGHATGFVTNLHAGDAPHADATKRKLAEGQRLDARVLSVEGDKVLFTLKPRLVANPDCLTSVEMARVGAKFPGVVAKSTPRGSLIVFYGNVKGWLDVGGMGGHVTDPENYFFVGQVVDVYITNIDGAQLSLSLFPPPPAQEKPVGPHVGGRYSATVRAVQNGGVDVTIDDFSVDGFVPDAHLSDSISICRAVKETLCVGQRLVNLLYVGGAIYSRREGMTYASRRVPTVAEVKVGDVVRCSYVKRKKNKVHVRPLIVDYTDAVVIPKEMFDRTLPELVEHQLLLAKVTRIEPSLELSIRLNDVYDGTVESTLRMYGRHFDELAFAYRSGRKRKWPICRYRVGEPAEGSVEKVGENGGCVVRLSPDGATAIAAPALCPASVQVGDRVTGVVIGHDFARRYVDVCLTRALCRKMAPREGATGGGAVALPASAATKLLLKDDYVVCLLADRPGDWQLVNLPRRVHHNDFVGCDAYYERRKFKICVCGKVKSYWLGMSRAQFLRVDKSGKKRAGAAKPLETDHAQSDVVVDAQSDGGEVSEAEEAEAVVETSAAKQPVALPDVSSFFRLQTEDARAADESSGDEDDEADAAGARERKKKMSASERAHALRLEEERIGNVERELADETATPQSAEQFDRLLLAHPDSAELWSRYVAFHVAGTEIDKARAVAERALATIRPTLADERLKMALVRLNLENLFGTRASFDACFERAARENDARAVYAKTVEMLARDVAKRAHADEVCAKARAKFKRDASLWCDVAATYYRAGRAADARPWRQTALRSIDDKKSQMALIVRFAVLEFQHGDADEGAAIFETIVRADPRRVSAWTTYADQLTKRGRADDARAVLDRALAQPLPLRSARALFLKRQRVEEAHGDARSIDAIKTRAQRYVDAFCSK